MPDRAAPELVLDARATLGEGPLWDARRGVLWWLDILAREVHAFHPASAADRSWDVGAEVGAAALDVDGRLLLGLPDRLAAFDPADGTLTAMADLPAGPVPLRCNDCRPDPEGRLWLGRMAFDESEGAGSLMRVERDGTVVTVLDGLTCPNGMAWPAADGGFLFIDSPRRTVDRYPWDPAAGSVGPPVPVVDLATTDLPAGAMPDGMAIDARDHVWLAVWGGGCLLRIAPNGRIEERVTMPVSQPTSCAFGGPGLDELYVTSARAGLGAGALAHEPHAGGVFRLRAATPGRPADVYRPARLARPAR
jgi:sugar lactone lactonase YvrE